VRHCTKSKTCHPLIEGTAGLVLATYGRLPLIRMLRWCDTAQDAGLLGVGFARSALAYAISAWKENRLERIKLSRERFLAGCEAGGGGVLASGPSAVAAGGFGAEA
jgi:hypothetical protein